MNSTHLILTINNLPLAKKDADNTIKVYKVHSDLQRKIKTQGQVNLANRLQQTHRYIKLRIHELQQLYNQHSSDPRAQFVQILKMQLSQAISPVQVLNKIADSHQHQKLVLPSDYQSQYESKSQQSYKETGFNRSLKINTSPYKAQKAPLQHQNSSKTPTKKPIQVGTLNLQDIKKKSAAKDTQQNDFEMKMKKQFSYKPNQTQRLNFPSKSPRSPTPRPVTDARSNLNKSGVMDKSMSSREQGSLQGLKQLKLTIKMTKQQYYKFVKQVQSNI